jgi:glycosyltransferase involved in cell wall biosynthesis
MHRRVKVLMLTGYLAGGGARSILEIAKGIDRSRFKVTVCRLLKGYHSKEPDCLTERFDELGVQVTSICPREVGAIRGWLSLYRFLRERDITILHTHSPYSGFLGRVIGRAAGVPVIVSTQHTVEAIYSLKTRLLDQLTFPLADSVVCVSEGVRDSLHIGTRLVLKRMAVIHNGVDISSVDEIIRGTGVEARGRWGWRRGDPVVGNVARLSPLKNQKCLIEAMRLIVGRKPRARLAIVGWGELEQELESQVERSQLQDHVVFLGHRTASEVFEILAAIDVFALPSMCEGFSLTILEAMAAGKPVVATDVVGVREAVVDGETGLLVPFGDPHALAEAILDLLEDPGRSRAMGAAGRRHVEKLFSATIMAHRYEQLYEELIRKTTNSVEGA